LPPVEFKVGEIPAGKIISFEFKVTVQEKSNVFGPNYVYPLIGEYAVGGKCIALINAVVGMDVPMELVPIENLDCFFICVPGF